MNFNEKKQWCSKQIDSDSMIFFREIAKQFGQPEEIEYINKQLAFRINNKTNTVNAVKLKSE